MKKIIFILTFAIVLTALIYIGLIGFEEKPFSFGEEEQIYIEQPKLSRAYTDAFIITERTEYGLTQNTVYVTITDNVGKAQIINLSNLFTNDAKTDSFKYGDIYMNLSYLEPVYGFVNTSIGKYSKTNQTTNATHTVNHYYDSNNNEMFCESVLGDKSCLITEYKPIANVTKYDYQKIPAQKTKSVIDGQVLEFKNGGIPLPKNGTIQLRYSYTRPIAFGLSNKPSEEVNKFDIEVCGTDGIDCSILDPAWWNNSWVNKRLINFTDVLTIDINRSEGFDSVINGLSVINCTNEIIITKDVAGVEQEVPSYAEHINNTACRPYFTVNKSDAESEVNYYIYYNNPTATAPSYSTYLSVSGSTIRNNIYNITITDTSPSLDLFDNLQGINVTVTYTKGIAIREGNANGANTVRTLINSGAVVKLYINTSINSFNVTLFNNINGWKVSDFKDFTSGNSGMSAVLGMGAGMDKCITYRNTTEGYSSSCGDLADAALQVTNYYDFKKNNDNGTYFAMFREGYSNSSNSSQMKIYLRDADANDPQFSYPGSDFSNDIGNVDNWNWSYMGVTQNNDIERERTFKQYYFPLNYLVGAEQLSDPLYPIFSNENKTANNSIFLLNDGYSFNITIVNTNGTSGLSFNSINYSMSNVSSLFGVNIFNISVGTYPYYFWSYGNGTSNLYNQTALSYYTIAQYVTVLNISVLPTNVIPNGTQSTVAGNGCSSQITCILYRDNVNVSNPDIQTLPVGNYTYVFNTTGNTNYSSATSINYLNVTTVTSDYPQYFNLAVSPSNGSAYSPSNSHRFNSSWIDSGGNASITVTFNFNGVNYTASNTSTLYNVTLSALNVGTYPYYWYAVDNGGNSNVTSTFYYTVVKANPSVSLSITPSLSIQNGTQSIATCTVNPGSAVLTRNGVSVSNPDIQNLSVGSYIYNCSVVSSSNYNAGSDTQTLVVSPIAFGGTNGTINFTTGNLTQTVNFQVPYQFVTNAFMNLTSLTGNSTSNITNLNITISSKQIFSYNGLFNQSNNRTQNFYSQLNSYLSTCTYIQGICYVPITFISATPGELFYSDVTINNFGFIEHNITYTSPVVELSDNRFSINVSYDSTSFNAITGLLNYNNTDYLTTRITNGNNIFFYADVEAPSVSANTNVPFYFIFGLTNSTSTYYFNSTLNNQTVVNLNIDDCSAYSFIIMNYTTHDEDNPSLRLIAPSYNNTYSINLRIGNAELDSYVSYARNISGNEISICSQTQINQTLRLDSELEYGSSAHVTEKYYIQNYQLNQSTANKNYTLYDLLTTSSDECLITVKDDNLQPYADVLVEMQRKYISTGNFSIVEIPKTDSFGKTLGHFVVNSETYNVHLKRNGITLKEYNNVLAVTDSAGVCNLYLTISQSYAQLTDYDSSLNITYAKSYNETSKIYLIEYSAVDSISKNVTLVATIFNPGKNVTVCQTQDIGVSGSISCSFDIASNQTVAVQVLVDGQELYSELIKVTWDFVTDEDNYLIAVVVLLLFVVMGVSNGGTFTIIFYFIGLIVLVSLSLIRNTGWFGATVAVVWFIIAGILLLYKINKTEKS